MLIVSARLIYLQRLKRGRAVALAGSVVAPVVIGVRAAV
jgi:hypothetical protein